MSVRPNKRRVSVPDMEAILAVASKLAAPFDLKTMLSEVVSAAKQVLRADRGTVWLYDAAADQLVIEVATGFAPVRIPTSVGLAGACARHRQIINVPDCYADERFNPEVDKRSGYRTRCMLSLPLVDHKDGLVGVMQVLNKVDGVFEETDEALATVLAAQCAVALQRVRMTEDLIEGEKMRQELETARLVQMSTLPATMPLVSGYDIYVTFKPAALTGGDTFDLSVLDQAMRAGLADATSDGIAPALSVTQMQAMLRMPFRLGADLETAFMQVNNQLADILADDRFITAFVGLLDPSTHRVRFHSGGQGPILHLQAASGTCATHQPTSFSLGAMLLSSLPAATILDLRPGDILLLLSDGIYEYRSRESEDFGQERVEAIVRDHHRKSAAELAGILLESVRQFAGSARQEDDMTVVLVKREARPSTAHRSFRRSFDSIPDIFALTEEVFASERIDPALLPSVDLTLEELFTNMVKYSASSAAVRIDMAKVQGGGEVTLTDYEAEPFDITQAPDANIDLPVEQRKPGGLGLHLIRRLVDCVHYEYSTESRQSRITFRKTQAGASASDRGTVAGSANAHD